MTEAQAKAQEEAIKKANQEARDWRAKCRKCGRELKGTLAELQAHKC